MQPETKSSRSLPGRGARVALAFAAVAALAIVLSTGALAVEAWRAGTLIVQVDEAAPDGANIQIRLPMILAEVAAVVVPSRYIWQGEAAIEAARYWPLVEAALSGLDRAPNGTLVHVESEGERVRIEKRDGALVVDVRERGDHVHIEIPLHAVTMLARALGPPATAKRLVV